MADSAACGYEWESVKFVRMAFQMTPPDPVRMHEVCVLPRGHEGDHQSARKVTHAQAR